MQDNKRAKIRIFNRTNIIVCSFALAAMITAGGFIWQSVRNVNRYKRLNEAAYMRAFVDLCDYMSSITTSLEKSLYVTGAQQMVGLTSELYRQAGGAKNALGQLPLEDASMDGIHKFLAQASDYMYSLTRKVMDEQEITEEEREMLTKLSDYAGKLSDSLVTIENGITAARSSDAVMSLLKKKLDEKIENINFLGDVENLFTDYPRIIYDGPFSDHVNTKPYAYIDSMDEVNKEEALKKAADFAGVDASALKYIDKFKGSLERYSFTGKAEDGGDLFIEVTVKGGCIFSYLREFEAAEEKLSDEEALEIAKKFLADKGVSDMIETYCVTEEGIFYACMAYEQDEVICYPDLIKVGVELSKGEIVTYEPGGYLQNHIERELLDPSLTIDEAREKVSGQLEVLSEGLAIIPTPSKEEAMCYEFKCMNEAGKEVISYINVETGREQDLLLIIDTGRGKLTM